MPNTGSTARRSNVRTGPPAQRSSASLDSAMPSLARRAASAPHLTRAATRLAVAIIAAAVCGCSPEHTLSSELSPPGQYIYVVNARTSDVQMIDTATMAPVGAPIGVGA